MSGNLFHDHRNRRNGRSDKMIKISGKVDKSNPYNGFGSNMRSLFKEELQTQSAFE